MKKLTLVFVSLMAFTLYANAQDFRVSAGVGGMFELNRLTFSTPMSNGGVNLPYLGVNAFFDFTYAAISLGYAAQAGLPTLTEDLAAYQSSAINSHFGFLKIRAIGKYPFQLAKGFALFPQVGIEYDLLVANDSYSLMTSAQKSDASDVFLVFGLGTDIDLNESIYLRIAADFDYNLTPTPSNPMLNETYGGFKINADLSLGFRF